MRSKAVACFFNVFLRFCRAAGRFAVVAPLVAVISLCFEVKNIFGTDGVRGVVFGDIMNPVDFLDVSFAVASCIIAKKKGLGKPLVLLGRDTRSSSDIFCPCVTSAFLSSGIDVIDCGEVTVSALSYLARLYNADGAAMISASHNTSEYNGLKILNSAGEKLPIEEEEAITKAFLDIKNGGARSLAKPDDIGSLRSGFVAALDYQKYILENVWNGVKFDNMKVVVDSANGSAGRFARKMFRFMGAEVVSIFDSPDGKNINSGCGAIFPEAASKKVLEVGARVGFCFDGDGDRIVVVDENGRALAGDLIIASFAKFLKKDKDLECKDVVVTRVSNSGLDKFLRNEGLAVTRVDIGDRFVLSKMKELGSVIGGEESGHIIVKPFTSIGDGVINAVLAMRMMQESGERASKVFAPFDPVPSIKKNINHAVSDVSVLDEGLRRLESELAIFAKDKEAYVVIRRSGTENVIRALVEAEDVSTAELCMERAVSGIKILIGQ